MMKNIEIPESLFNRLAKHASGFDTPINVITQLLDYYEGSNFKSNVNKSIVQNAFQEAFNVDPRSFGLKTSVYSGYSDNNNGVQWNIIVNRNTGAVSLGVNLEGVKYKDWPITNLLLAERENMALLDLTDIDQAKNINFKMTRDAWQAAARPEIAERFITQEDFKLASLNKPQWSRIIEESLACLDEKSGFRKRGNQTVYLTKSNVSKVMPTSPHLSFSLQVSTNEPKELPLFIESLKHAKSVLMPLYKFALKQSDSKDA